MKKLFMLSIILFSSIVAFSQTATIDGNKETMKKAVEKGVFEISMPSSVSIDDINKNKEYYTDYFTVDYNDANKLATITMVDDSAKSRRVITRLLLSVGVKEVNVDGKDYTFNDFFNTFLQ